MIRRTLAGLLHLGTMATPAAAQNGLLLPIGTSVPLVTVDPLSSKTSVKGDMVRLATAADVIVEGTVAIPAGTAATGQIVDARAKGAMGMSGRLMIRPIYLTIGQVTVRLSGTAGEKASVTAGAVIGTVVLAAPFFTGRSAHLPAGTRVSGMIERSVSLQRP